MKLSPLAYLFTFYLCLACSYDNIVTIKSNPKSFEWSVSEFSPRGNFFQFSTDEDNKLYGHGFLDGNYGIHKWTGTEWTSVVKLKWDSLSIQSFAVLKQKVYLINYTIAKNSLLRASGNMIENVTLSGRMTYVAQTKGKLVVVGDLVDAANSSYGVAYSDDGSTFTPLSLSGGVWIPDQQFIAPGLSLENMENRMFINDNKGKTFEFDGNQLKFFRDKSFKLIDEQDNYYWTSYESQGDQIKKTTKEGIITDLGNIFSKGNDVLFLFLRDSTIISINQKSGLGLSSTYYFDGTEWKSINTTNYFLNAFKYNGRLLANCSDGLILELVAK